MKLLSLLVCTRKFVVERYIFARSVLLVLVVLLGNIAKIVFVHQNFTNGLKILKH